MHAHLLAALLAGCPFRHHVYNAQCLGIELGVYGFQYLGIGDATILLYHKLHDDTTLLALLLCLLGVLDIRIDKLHQFGVATRELRTMLYHLKDFITSRLGLLHFGSLLGCIAIEVECYG